MLNFSRNSQFFNLKNLLFSTNLISKMTTLSTSNHGDDRTLETLNFDNLVLRSLPIDTIEENYVREVRNACFSRVRISDLIMPNEECSSNFQR